MLDESRFYKPGEVAGMFRVDPKTVSRWAQQGRLGSIRTPGGHRRFYRDEVNALLLGYGGGAPTEPKALAG